MLYFIKHNAKLQYTKREEINIMSADFNAKMGTELTEDIVGNYGGVGTRNEKGERLI